MKLNLKIDKPTELVIDNVNWPEVFDYKPETKVTILASAEALTLRYHVRGLDLRAEYDCDHGEVWTDSCCEFFLQPEGQSFYYNIEINACGAMTVSSRTARNENVWKFPAEQMARITRFAPLGRKSFPEKEGMQEWEVGMTIPYALILGMSDEEWKAAGAPVPHHMRGNFYKCGDKTPHPHFVSWAPITTENPDFHQPAFFGEIEIQ